VPLPSPNPLGSSLQPCSSQAFGRSHVFK
jgi:hypothetical protein